MSRISLSGLLPLALFALTSNSPAQVSSPAASPANAVISGRITKGGKAVPFVAVILEPFDLTSPKSSLLKSFTNNEGRYRITGVPEGRYQVKPLAPALVVVGLPESDKAGTGVSSNRGFTGFVVTVTRGDVVEGIDFAVEPGGVVTGRVTDDAGRPVVAVQVGAQRINDQGQMFGGSSEFATDDRGIYRIFGLPAGNYLVFVSGSGRFPSRRYRTTFHPDTIDKTRATEVQVATGGESTGIDIRVGQPQRTYSVSGHLVAQDTGKPLPGVYLSFSGAGSEGGTTTDSSGTFKIENCELGNYQLKVATTSTGHKGYYSDPVMIAVSDADITDVEIRAIRGITVSGYVIVQDPRDPAIGSGSFQSAAMIATNRQPGLRGSEVTAGAAPINPDGSFEFTGLRPARLELRPVSLPEGFAFLRIEREGAPMRDVLTLSAGDNIEGLRVVVAYGKGSINGQIKVEGGLLPARMQWQVTVRRVDGDGETIYQFIDARGHFWVKNLPPALYEIAAEADYVEIPGVTPSLRPGPIKQTIAVTNSESQVLLVLDLKGKQ